MPKSPFKVIFKKELIPKVYFVTFQAEYDSGYRAGQFFSIEVANKEFRPYSTVHCSRTPPIYFPETKALPVLEEGEYVSFMISTKPGGIASEYFDKVENNQFTTGVGPSGSFRYYPNDRPKAFIATGTGLAPFVPMVEGILKNNPLADLSVFFGCWKISDNFCEQFFPNFYNKPAYPNFKIYILAEDIEGNPQSNFLKEGRVTTVVPATISEVKDSDYYICGHPAMCTAMEEVLKEHGCEDNVFSEKFGK